MTSVVCFVPYRARMYIVLVESYCRCSSSVDVHLGQCPWTIVHLQREITCDQGSHNSNDFSWRRRRVSLLASAWSSSTTTRPGPTTASPRTPSPSSDSSRSRQTQTRPTADPSSPTAGKESQPWYRVTIWENMIYSGPLFYMILYRMNSYYLQARLAQISQNHWFILVFCASTRGIMRVLQYLNISAAYWGRSCCYASYESHVSPLSYAIW